MVAMAYVPEQQVGGFSTIETKGSIESACVVAEGDEDIVYVEVMRTVNGQAVRFVERMNERQYTDLKECVYVDCAGTYRGEAKKEITGLTWLEGETVSILADGAVEPQQVVKDGKITLTYPAEIVHVGLPFIADMKTLPAAMRFRMVPTVLATRRTFARSSSVWSIRLALRRARPSTSSLNTRLVRQSSLAMFPNRLPTR